MSVQISKIDAPEVNRQIPSIKQNMDCKCAICGDVKPASDEAIPSMHLLDSLFEDSREAWLI